MKIIDRLKMLWKTTVDMLDGEDESPMSGFENEGFRSLTSNEQGSQILKPVFIPQKSAVGIQGINFPATPTNPLYTEIASTPLTKDANNWQQFIGGISQGMQEKQVLEETKGLGKIGEKIGQATHRVGENLAMPTAEALETRDYRKKWYKENEDMLGNLITKNVLSKDRDKMEEIKDIIDQKNTILASPDIDDASKKILIDGMDKSIFETARTFSKIKDDTQVPDMDSINGIIDSYRNNEIMGKERIIKRREETPYTYSQEVSGVNDYVSGIYAKIANGIDNSQLQGRNYRGRNLTFVDASRAAQDVMSTYEISQMLSKPYEAKQAAEAALATLTDPDKIAKAKKIIETQTKAMQHNDQYVVPYVQWMVSHLGTDKGKNRSELTKAYLKEKGLTVQEVFGEINPAYVHGEATQLNQISNILDKNSNIDYTINRGDAAQQDLTRARMLTEGIGPRIMDRIGLGFAQAENKGNAIKGIAYGKRGLGKMDIAALKNVDSQIAPPQGIDKQTWQAFKNFGRKSIQMSPEIIIQIAPWIIGEGEISALEKASEVSKVARLAETANETVRLIDQGVDIATAAKTATKLNTLLGSTAPEFAKLVSAGTDPYEAINLVSKGDFFTKKVLFGPIRYMVENYLQSAALQGKNPKQYSKTDFWIDGTFSILDTVLSIGKALNHYSLDNIKYKDAFLSSFSKEFFDISDADRVKLNKEDILGFNKVSEGFLKEYESQMAKNVPQKDIQEYISNYKDRYGRMNVDEIIDHSKSIDPDFDLSTLDYDRAKNKNLIPEYVTEDDYNLAMNQFGGNEKSMTNFMQDLRDLDRKKTINGATDAEKADVAHAFVDKVIDNNKLSKEPGVYRGLNNFVEDIDSTMGGKGKIDVDGQEYNYQFFDQNTSGKTGERTIKGVSKKSKGEFSRTSYILTLPGEDLKLYKHGDRNVDYDIIDAAGNVLNDAAARKRMLSFFRVNDPKNPGMMRGTASWEKQGLVPEKIKSISKEEDIATIINKMKSEMDDIIRDANGDIVSYKGITVEKKDPDVLITDGGKPVAARYLRDQKAIRYSPENMQKKFDDKAWTKAQTQGVTPLPEDQFKTYEDWEEFVFEHEYSHDVEAPRNIYNETVGQYEDRINQAALRNIEKKKGINAPIAVPSPLQNAKSSVKILDKTSSTLSTASYLDKTHWFSTLNDVLKRSNIDNDGFQISKAEYKVNGQKLREALQDIFTFQKKAAKQWDKAKMGGPFQWDVFIKDPANSQIANQYLATIEEVKKFVSDTIDTFFPQDVLISADIGMRTLKEKATDKLMKSLRVGLTPQNKMSNLRTTTFYNDISVLSKLTKDGGLGEFMKFFDRDKFKIIRDDPFTFKKYFNVNFASSDWQKYKKLWKYVGNDTSESQFVKVISKVLGADVYRFGQTVVNIAGIPKLLVMNSLSWLTENMRKYNIMNYADEELYAFRNKYNVLHSADEFTNSDLIKDLSKINREGLSNALSKLQNKVVDLYSAGFYNAADIFYSSTRRNQSIGQALEEIFPQLKGMNDVDNFLSSMSREERIKALTKVHDRAEEILNKATGQYVDFWKGQMAFGGPLHKVKSAIYRTYGLMGARGTGMMKSSLETVGHALNGTISRSTVGKRYRKILMTDGKAAADERVLRYLQVGDDFHHLFEKMNLGIMLGFKQDRAIADDDGEDTVTDTIREGLELGKNYSFPIQAFESNPYGRAVLAFFGGLFDDMESEGTLTPGQLGWDNFKAGGITMGKQIVTDMFRRFAIPKSVISAIAKASDGGNFWLSLADAYRKNTGGFLYYSALDITQNGFDEYMPLTPYSFLQEISPYTDKYISDWRDQGADYTMKKLLSDWKIYGTSWLLYNMPLIKDRKLGQMQATDIYKKTAEIIHQDPYYMLSMNKGELDWSLMGKDAGLYAYNQITNFSSMKSEFKDPENRLEPLRRKFSFEVDGEEKISKVPQNQEDIFVSLLKDALNDGRYDEFVNLFNQSVEGNQKAATQMLAFAEGQSPGAGKELLANIVSGEWYTMLGNIDGRVNGSPDKEKSVEIQRILGEKYGDLIYITDKPVGWKNLSLFYLRQAHPELQEYISTPYGENGMPNKNTNFIYGDPENDKEYDSKDYALSQIFAMDMVSNIATAQGDPNGHKMFNAFSAITIPKSIDDKSLAYTGLMLEQVNRSLDYFNKSDLPRQTITPMKSGTIVAIYNKLGGDVIEALLNSEHRQTLLDTMSFLHGTTKEIIEEGKARGTEQWFEDEFGTSFNNSNYYNSNKYKYGLNNELYDAVKKLSYLYSSYNSYGSKNYGSRYYSKKDRDYLVEYGKSVGTGVARVSSGGKDKPTEQGEPTGRTPVQKGGTARPLMAKKEDPDKPVDFAMMSTLKRRLSRKAIKYDNRRIGESGSKGGLYNVSYKGGDRKRRVSRAKGGDAKRLAEYNKANRQVLKT